MSQDFSKLSKRELVELVSKMAAEEAPKAPAANDADAKIEELIAQNQKLMAALVSERTSAQAARNAVQVSTGQDVHEVRNLVTKSIGIFATDDRGVKRHYLLEERGSKVLLTAAQITELQRERPELFESGMLAAPSFLTESNPNAISDIEEFLNGLEFDAIAGRVGTITSVDVLYQIYHTIENKRWIVDDGKGNPVRDETGALSVKEVQLPAKLVLVEQAVAARLKEVANVQLDLHGSE